MELPPDLHKRLIDAMQCEYDAYKAYQSWKEKLAKVQDECKAWVASQNEAA